MVPSSRFALAMFFFFSSAVPLSLSCGTSCEEVAADAFTLVVKDARTGKPLCDAVVAIEDGSFVTTPPATPVQPECVYRGPSERPGHYGIHVTHSSYVSQDADVTVTQDGCHVVLQKVRVDLEPSP